MEQLQEGFKFTFLYGEKKVEYKQPVIAKELVKRKYWFGYKTLYYIDYEFCRIGPMTLKNAEEHIRMAMRYWR